MNRVGRYGSGRKRQTSTLRHWLLGALTVVTVGAGAPTCWLETPPGLYRCNETNNCVDVPTTVCKTAENRCVCPVCNYVFCPEYNKCIPVLDCYPDEILWDCSSGSGGGSGGGGGIGGSAGGGGE